jgi:tRNA 2-thiouridine synthesizing protein E
MVLMINTQRIDVDPEGYLVDLSDWNEDVARALAAQDDLDLTEAHWELIRFLRDYYAEYQIAPAMRALTRAASQRLGRDKANSRYLYQLFPDGPARQGCKIAGLPKPANCF